MKGYAYDKEGYLIAEIELKNDPRSGAVLLPADTTTEPPPKDQPGLESQWNGTAWALVTSRKSIKEQEKIAEDAQNAAAEIAQEEWAAKEDKKKDAIAEFKKLKVSDITDIAGVKAALVLLQDIFKHS